MSPAMQLEYSTTIVPRPYGALAQDGEGTKATNTAKHPNSVMPHKGGDAAVQDGELTARLPRLSWNVIHLSRSSAG